MTAHCRLLPVTALALLLPACLHLDTQAAPSPEPPAKPSTASPPDTARKTQFAELLSRPGVVVPLKPAAKDATTPLTSVEPTVNDTNVVVVDGNSGNANVVDPAVKPQPDCPLLNALHAYAENHPDRAIDFLASLGKQNQDFVLALLPVLWQGATADLTADPHATALLADQLRSAAVRLEPAAALRLEAVALCKKVEGYGMYIAWPKGQPYRPYDLAQLYIEVRNLVSQPASGPNGETFVTHYRAITEIRDAYGKLVDQLNPIDYRTLIPVVTVENKRFTHTPVHDFHILYRFQAPSAPGVYTISVKVEDLSTHRTVKTEPIQFTVAGP